MSSQNRYLTLDGMRGVAALCVVILHTEGLHPSPVKSAYLAVDLFFVLSGFVIAHAYKERFAAGMGVRAFMLRRWIRLYPLYLIGSLLGMAGAAVALIRRESEYSVFGATLASISAFFMLPSPTWWERPHIYGLDVPAWSLLMELAANAIYVVIAPYLTQKRLIGLISISALLFATQVYRFGSADIGYAWNMAPGALARVMFSFFFGVLLYERRSAKPLAQIMAVVLPLSLIAVFSCDPTHWRRAAFDMTCIVFLFPTLVSLAARTEPAPALRRCFALLGAASYAIYIIHLPAWELSLAAARTVGVDAANVDPYLGFVFAAVMLGLAIGADRYIDSPVRRWLTARLCRPHAALQGQPMRNPSGAG